MLLSSSQSFTPPLNPRPSFRLSKFKTKRYLQLDLLSDLDDYYSTSMDSPLSLFFGDDSPFSCDETPTSSSTDSDQTEIQMDTTRSRSLTTPTPEEILPGSTQALQDYLKSANKGQLKAQRGFERYGPDAREGDLSELERNQLYQIGTPGAIDAPAGHSLFQGFPQVTSSKDQLFDQTGHLRWTTDPSSQTVALDTFFSSGEAEYFSKNTDYCEPDFLRYGNSAEAVREELRNRNHPEDLLLQHHTEPDPLSGHSFFPLYRNPLPGVFVLYGLGHGARQYSTPPASELVKITRCPDCQQGKQPLRPPSPKRRPRRKPILYPLPSPIEPIQPKEVPTVKATPVLDLRHKLNRNSRRTAGKDSTQKPEKPPRTRREVCTIPSSPVTHSSPAIDPRLRQERLKEQSVYTYKPDSPTDLTLLSFSPKKSEEAK